MLDINLTLNGSSEDLTMQNVLTALLDKRLCKDVDIPFTPPVEAPAVVPTFAAAPPNYAPPAPVAQAAPVAAPAPVAPIQTGTAPSPVPTAANAASTAVPTSAPTYTLDQIANAGATLVDAGKMGELIGLLGQFGVAAVTDLKPEQYGAFATALRGLGARI